MTDAAKQDSPRDTDSTPDGRPYGPSRLPAPASNETLEDWPEPASLEAERAEFREYQRLMFVLRVAPTIEIAEALLRGEEVPRSRLDETWLRAYGR